MSSSVKYGNNLALQEHLSEGKPITRLEAITLYGISNLTSVISGLRQKGWLINKRDIPFSAAVKRLNEFTVYKPPENLPTKEIILTEWWLSK